MIRRGTRPCRTSTTAAAATAAAAAGTGGKLLTSLLKHLLFVLAWANNPHHQVVGFRWVLKKQGGAQTKPTKDLLLLVTHGHRHEFRFWATVGRFCGSFSRGSRLRLRYPIASTDGLIAGFLQDDGARSTGPATATTATTATTLSGCRRLGTR